MFLLFSIWKRLSTGLIITLMLGASLLGTSEKAFASGEQYSWTNTTDSSITASGGSYTAPVTYKKGTPTASDIPFIAQGTITCAATPIPATFQIAIKTSDYQKTIPTPGAISISPNKSDPACQKVGFDPVLIPASKPTTTSAPADNTCDQGSLTWIACPVIGQLAGVISTLAKTVLTPLLEVRPISAQSTPGLYQTWQHIRDFSEVLFVIAFLIMIFATVTGNIFDSYTVKKLLPRIIASAIMIHFSFLLSGMVIDFGNILGSGIDSIIGSVTGATSGAHSVSNFLEEVGTTGLAIAGGYGAFIVFGSWLALGPILLGMLLSILAILLTLGARYIALAILITISPLAFVAWILPNTEHYFKAWYTALIRLVMMYPIIIAILSVAGRINELLGNSGQDLAPNGGTSVIIAIVKPFIIIATFLVIPKTFQWAGSALGAVGQTFNGMTTSTRIRHQKSEFSERGRTERSSRRNERLMAMRNPESTLGKWSSGGRLKRAAAGGLVSAAAFQMGGTPSDPASLNRLYAKNMKSYGKELDTLPEADNPFNIQTALKAAYGDRKSMDILRASAPTLVTYTRTAAGRAALAAKRASSETTEISELNQILKSTDKRRFPAPSKVLANEYSAINSAMGKERQSKPFVLTRITKETYDYKIKDVAGVDGPPIHRTVGDVDINGVVGTLRRLTAPSFRDKFSQSNLAVLQQRTDARASAKEQLDALELSQAVIEGLDSGVVAQTFDHSNRNALNISTKIDWYKSFKANNDVFMRTPNGQVITDAALAQLASDPDLLGHMRTVAGISPAAYGAMSTTQKVDAIRNWLNT